ncbi:MAG TPA: hypothetical protein VFF69_15600 [Phycisphaerales bacterium]|nr:hypothetical protein [Phycisphaerales bacterium]
MKGRGLAAAAAAIAAAGAACGQTITYFWTVTTDNGDTDIGPGEDSAYLSLWAHMAPEATGIAGSIYDIRGIENWDTGEITSYSHLLSAFGEVSIQSNNDIVFIESFQLPPAFNRNFDASNPVELFRITWTASDFSARTVELGDANHLNNDVYTDEFGSSVPYEGVPGVAEFTIAIPGPGGLLLLGLGALGRRVRR